MLFFQLLLCKCCFFNCCFANAVLQRLSCNCCLGLGAILGRHVEQSNFWLIFKPILVRFWRPRGGQISVPFFIYLEWLQPGGMHGTGLDSLSSRNSKDYFEIRLDTLRPFGWRRIHPSFISPRAPRSPPGHPLKRAKSILKSIQILIIFGHRFWVVLGSFWRAIWGSFSTLLAAKWGSVQSKTRLESLSSWKTWISTKHYACRYRSDVWNPKVAPKMPEDRPKTAPRGSWRAICSLLKIVWFLVRF